MLIQFHLAFEMQQVQNLQTPIMLQNLLLKFLQYLFLQRGVRRLCCVLTQDL